MRIGQAKGFTIGVILGGLLASMALAAVFWDRPIRRGPEKLVSIISGQASAEAANQEAYQDLFAYVPPRIVHDRGWGVPSPTHPDWTVRRGYDIRRVATGFDYPVNLTFAETDSDDDEDDAVRFYVAELHGTVKYVTHAGEVGTFATGLRSFPPIPKPETDQTGLSGLCAIPGSRDLLVTSCDKDPESGLLRNRLLRLVSSPDGRTAERVDVVLDIDEYTSPSHQIQQVSFGPDGKLYIAVGDGENPHRAGDLDKWGGKVLRLNLDGSACSDNPFYDPAHPDAARSYVYAYGIRNVFGFDFDPVSGRLYAAGNGYRIDRLYEVHRGKHHGWDGHQDATRLNALYTWGPVDTLSPTGLQFLRHPVLGAETAGRLFMGTFNPRKLSPQGQAVLEMHVDPETGMLTRRPEPLVQFHGEGMSNVIGLAEGPDGLYFADLFGPVTDGRQPGHGTVWKIVADESTLSAAADTASLQGLSPVERGRAHFIQQCTGCHRVAGVGGTAGPDLTHAYTNLSLTLNGRGYEAKLDELISSEQDYFVEQRTRLKEVRQAEGDQRVRKWLYHHLLEPKFDNPMSQMPSFRTLDTKTREDLIAYLMTLK